MPRRHRLAGRRLSLGLQAPRRDARQAAGCTHYSNVCSPNGESSRSGTRAHTRHGQRDVRQGLRFPDRVLTCVCVHVTMLIVCAAADLGADH